MQSGEKFMDKQRQPKVEGTQDKKGFMEPAQNTGYTVPGDRITPYDPDELKQRKEP